MYHLIADTNIQIFIPYIVAISLSVGFFSGLLGIGGAFILIPLLIFMGVPASSAITATYAQLIVSSVSATYKYKKQKILSFKLAGLLTSISVVGALIGGYIFYSLNQVSNIELIIRYCFIGLLCFAIILLIRLPKKMKKLNELYPIFKTINYLKIIIIGLCVGIFSGLLGIGGGFLIVPCLVYFIALQINEAKAISQFNMMCVSLVSLIIHAVINKNIDYIFMAILVLSGLIGSEIGLRVDAKISHKRSRQIFILILIGTIMMLVYDLMHL